MSSTEEPDDTDNLCGDCCSGVLRHVAIMASKTSWRVVWLVFTVVLLVLVLTFYSFSQKQLETRPWYHFPAPCSMPPSVLTDMVFLALQVHEALDILNVSHAVCFGTLWGTLRLGKILPWDNNVDFCAFESYFTQSTSKVKDVLRQKGVGLKYDWTTGIYHLKCRSAVGSIHTYAVSRDGETAVPGGGTGSFWAKLVSKHRPTPVTFPARLLEAPLNAAKFYNKDMPVPHEDIEILKYMYPDDWWMEVKPPGC